MTRKRGNGEGTVVLRSDGRWSATITIEDEATGRKKRKAFYGKSKQEATAKMQEALADQRAGLPVDPKRMTVAQFLEQWLEESVKQTTRPTTYENYSVLVRVHLAPGLGSTDLQKLTAMQLQTFLNQKLASGLSTRTVQYLLVLLRRSLGLAVKWRLVGRNVALDVDPPRVTHREVKPLTVEQARQFLESVRGDKLEALCVAAVALGLRRGEVLALRWEDVDFEASTLAVRGSLQRVGGKLQVLDTKTEQSRRTVLMPQVVAQALRAHKTRQLEHRLRIGEKWHGHGLVFPNHYGGLNCPRRLNREFDEAVRRAGLPKVRLHDLRHGAATMLLASGVPVKAVSEVLGHSTTRMTLEIYSHVVDSMRQEAADEMDKLLLR